VCEIRRGGEENVEAIKPVEASSLDALAARGFQ
jgi:hypothetical protein